MRGVHKHRPLFPQELVELDPGNRFAAAVRVGAYAINNQYVYAPRTQVQAKAQVDGQVYRIGNPGGQPTGWGQGVRGGSGQQVWTARTYPADLVPSAAQTIVMWFQGRSDTWSMQSGSNNRLFDVSGGNSWRLNAVRQSGTTVNVKMFSFADTGAPDLIITMDPRAPLCVAAVHTGSGAVRLFLGSDIVYPRMHGTDTVTVDGAPGGTDCRWDCFGSGGTDIDYTAAFWFAGAFTDDEVSELMFNPTQLFLQYSPRRRVAAAANTVPWHYYAQQRQAA